MSSAFTFYSDFQQQIDQLVTQYVNNTAGNVIGSITPTVSVLFAIYVASYGWLMMQGQVREPVMGFVRRALKIGIISGIALSLGSYNHWVASFVLTLPNQLASAVTSGTNSSTSGLDHLLSQGYDVGNLFWQQSGLSNPGPALLALLVWATVFISTGYGAYLFALSAMALGVLVAVGPLFIALALFDATRNFLAQWIVQCVNYLLVSVLSVAVVGLIYAAVIAFSRGLTDPALLFSQAVPFLLALIIGFLLLMQVQSMASGLAGGVHLGTAQVLESIAGVGLGHLRRGGAQAGHLLRSRIGEAQQDVGELGSAAFSRGVRAAGTYGGRATGAALRGAEQMVAAGLQGAVVGARATGRAVSWARQRFRWTARHRS